MRTNSPDVRTILKASAGGTTRQRVAGGRIKELRLPLPPLSEQRRIVAKLDALTARLTRARAELDRMPRLVHKLRTCALATAFDNSFSVKQLNELSTFITSGSRGWAQFYSESGPAFIRVGDVRRGDIHLDTSELQRVQPPIGAEGNRTAAQPGDLVVTITADLGRVGIVPKTLGPAFVNQHVALVRLTYQTNAKWIAWYLCSEDGQRQLLSKDRGVTKAGLGLDDIRNVLIPIADAEDQEKIVKGIEAAFARADRLEAKAARSKKLLDRLESTILTKAFKGELVPQDPNDEPATQLLDRIRAQRATNVAGKTQRGRTIRAA
jgi:type I restriction enzyme S subunit